MLTRVNRDILRKLERYIEDDCPIYCRMVAESVLENIQRKISEKAYQILGEYLLYRLSCVVDAEGFRKAVVEGKGNVGRDLVYTYLENWLAEAYDCYRKMTEAGGSDLKDLFALHGFIRTPDPRPLTMVQAQNNDDLLGI